MLRPLFDIGTLTSAIESGALIITANNRLASKIHQAWGKHQVDQGFKTWHPPEVHSLESWLLENWQHCCDAGIAPCCHHLPVSPQQERILWELAITTDPHRPPLVVPSSYASSAQQGYTIIQQWQIPDAILTTDAPHLFRWISNFRDLMSQRHLITLSDCALQLKEIMTGGQLTRHQRILTVGFQTLPPLYHKLLISACRELEIPVREQPVNSTCARKIGLPDEIQELQVAATWAARTVAAEPDCRIGIVVPDLARLRPQVERIFLKHLLPDNRQQTFSSITPPFNISAGIPLAETPMVMTAMALLNLNRNEQALSDCCQLLNSFFWGEDNLPVRATAEEQLRNLAKFRIRTSEFRYQLSRAADLYREDGSTPALAAGLEQFEALRRQSATRNNFSGWATLFCEQLRATNWPGDRTLDSIEYQQQQHWLQLIEQFSALDQLRIEVDLYEALRHLQQFARQTVFQPETPDSPIQILGLLESAELRFDHLWVIGMNDRQWPQPCQPHPLLGTSIQRDYRTPRSSPEKELQLAQEQIDGYLCNAAEVVFSYSLKDKDRQLSCTPLIENIGNINIEQLLENGDAQEALYQPALLEQVDCSRGPALPMTNQPVKGGSAIFDTQAACPFNAFARYRLGAHSPPEPGLGLSARDRGSLLHLCLEYIWYQLKDQKSLLRLTEQQLDQLLNAAITDSLSRWQQSHPELLGERFTRLETQRLQRLLKRWLELEKQRSPFRIKEIEAHHDIVFADLPMSLRIDRVDLLENDKQFIIDYKTGNPGISSWMGERPEQPQLPLYALSSGEEVVGIAFAAINAEQQCFIGVTGQDSIAPGLTVINTDNNPNGWHELRLQWRTELAQLADEFKRGDAEVCFYNRAVAQWQAELLPLNRWPEYTASEIES